MAATVEGITPGVAAVVGTCLEQLWARESWEKPSVGFGLCGGTGVGKTGLLAVAAREWARCSAEHTLRTWSVLHGAWAPRWAPWTRTLFDLRSKIRQDGWALEDAVGDLAEAPLLVLDDLGKERESEWGAEVLEMVVETRLRHRRATLWSSNFSPGALAERYGRVGSPLVSRLCEIAPAFELPVGLTDRRVQGLFR